MTGLGTIAANRRTVPTDAITEEMIETLVRWFYAAVRDDQLLEPVFARVIDDWEPHLCTMIDFWSSVMLTTGRFKGEPVRKRRALAGIGPQHFETWQRLFRESAEAVCPPAAAARFIDKPERIGASLLLAMAARAGR